MKKVAALYVIGYVSVVLMFAYVVQRQNQDRQRDIYRLCILGNEFRQDLVNSQHQETEDLITASQEGKTKLEREESQFRVDSYRARREKSLQPLEPRNCGDPP